MVKRIIIMSVIYAIFVTALTLTSAEIGGSFIVLLLLGSFAFTILLVREVWKKYLVGFKPTNQAVSYESSASSNPGELKQISTKPFLFGLENKLLTDDVFYFDQENFYAVNAHSQKAIFKLSDIIELSKTEIEINKRRIWQVKIKQNNSEELVFKFAHNYTLWNKSFPLFYEKIMQINPAAVKSKWSLWTR